MNAFCIQGPTQLKGEIIISGAKNSALPILFCTLLISNPIEIKNIPRLKDIDIAIKLLLHLGAKIEFTDSLYVDTSKINNYHAPYELTKKIRASIWILGPLLARFGNAEIALPGGCNIGSRPIDLHITSLKKLGAIIYLDKKIKASVLGKLKGTHIIMHKISVGATITIMSAATLAVGTTIIDNAAREPEIADVANFLNQQGAKIIGAGTKRIYIQGVSKIIGNNTYRILSDRIETGTFLIAAAISKGNVLCRNICPNTLRSTLRKLNNTGAKITTGTNWISLNMKGKRPKSTNIYTSPYPGFPTDMQAQFTLLNMIAKGTSTITENIFENRFMHVPELIRMGAKAKIKGKSIICYGVKKLFSASVQATDLRASASLILAGCIAEGITIVNSVHHINRGYESIKNKLLSLGAKIKKI
jgi:UDP-N-acetylglucosamine 1-carboxyvinyltransferase